MQQPLCHLYFLTVMEHLQIVDTCSSIGKVNTNKVSFFLKLAIDIKDKLEQNQRKEAVILWIELQAVVQMLIRHVADCLNPEKKRKLGDIQRIMDDLNG